MKETHLFLLVIKLKNPFTIPKACARWKTKRGIGTSFFRADDYAVAKKISVNKYCTKVKIRASISETQNSHCQRITPLPRRMNKMFPMQCIKDAGGLFEKVLKLCLLLINMGSSLEILDNISVMLSTKKYDTDTSLSFSSRTSLWYSKMLH